MSGQSQGHDATQTDEKSDPNISSSITKGDVFFPKGKWINWLWVLGIFCSIFFWGGGREISLGLGDFPAIIRF